MWASHFVRNGNKLSISSWLTTEVATSLPEYGSTESSAPEPCLFIVNVEHLLNCFFQFKSFYQCFSMGTLLRDPQKPPRTSRQYGTEGIQGPWIWTPLCWEASASGLADEKKNPSWIWRSAINLFYLPVFIFVCVISPFQGDTTPVCNM